MNHSPKIQQLIMSKPTSLLVLFGLCIGTFVGCGGEASKVREGYLVKVVYDDNPIGGVEVRLYRSPHVDGAEPSFVGFSDNAGEAYLTPFGGGQPPGGAASWQVAVLSDGDGSWMIDPKFNNAGKSGLELQVDLNASPGDSPPVIRLPSGAVRILAP
jgi:hypothetical protein